MSAAPSHRGRARGRGWHVSPRTVWITMVVAAVLAVAVVIWLLLPRPPKTLVTPVVSANASFEGEIPAAPARALANPLGVAWTGGVLYVAESDAGEIRLFKPDGTPAGRIRLPVAPGAAKAYPSDIAALPGGRVAVVDGAGRRVVVLSADPSSAVKPVIIGRVRRGRSVGQPTAVAGFGRQIIIADGADHDLKVYDDSGRFIRTMCDTLDPRLTFVGGMKIEGRKLYVSDSTAGRVVILDLATGEYAGALPVRMILPRGIAGDGHGRLFVADQFGHFVSVFSTRDMSQLFRIDAKKTRGATLSAPRGLVWDAGLRRLFVTDAGSGRIERFALPSAD